MRNIHLWWLACLVGIARGVPIASAQSSPPLGLESIATGLKLPVFVTAPRGDTNHLFVVEQHAGRIRIITLSTRTVAPDAYLTIAGITTSNEQGLLGLAFHPNYLSNGFFFVNYTTTGGGSAGHTEITRFRAQGDPQTATIADPASKTVLLSYDQPEVNHNGGWLAFGLDGYLYASAGDGGGANDAHGAAGNGQNLNAFLGKILRMDVDHGSLYAIPTNNPFAGDLTKTQEIFAFGLRNPWRCSFDRITGDLWIGDVGQDTREEIDVIPSGRAGVNFGWRPREGLIQTPAHPSETPITAATNPVHDYSHALGNCVIGGYVYRGQAIPALRGTYLYGDYGSARFWSFGLDGTNVVNFQERTAELNAASPKPISQLGSFGEDDNGEIYLCDLATGSIYRIISTAPSVAVIEISAAQVAARDFSFQFTAIPNQPYAIESRASLNSGSWQTITNLIPPSSSAHVLIPGAVQSTQQFYRVRSP